MNLLFFIYFSEKKIIKAKHFLNEIFFYIDENFLRIAKMQNEKRAFSLQIYG